MNTKPRNRLVIVIRADPVICGHSVEGRNLAEAALERGFDDVRIVTWPIERLQATGLPLKPLDRMLPYSDRIIVERPEPVGDYKVPDGRYLAGITGRLVELFTDGVPTVCLSLYLSPHTVAVTDAVRAAWSTGLPVNVTTIAEAVGSDVTNVVRSCVERGPVRRRRPHPLELPRAGPLRRRVGVHPRPHHRRGRRVDACYGTPLRRAVPRAHRHLLPGDRHVAVPRPRSGAVDRVLAAAGSSATATCSSCRGSARGRVSTTSSTASSARPRQRLRLVIAGRGPEAEELRQLAAASPLPIASCSSTMSTTPRSRT